MKEKHLKNEAVAFDRRIKERVAAGFIPDLRRAVKCEYFYKSFFRDPYYIQLYQGQIFKWIIHSIKKYGGKCLKILDVGCGPGMFALELARNGYFVHAIDISSKTISEAKKVLHQNPYKENFGSLDYEVKSFGDVKGIYDVVLFSGVLHHFDDMENVVLKAKTHIRLNGLLICLEPCHEMWKKSDAAIVALLRALLSILGNWYEEDLGDRVYNNTQNFDNLVKEIHHEYFMERDENEPEGQSPNDLASSGEEILNFLRQCFKEEVYQKGFSFIYRFLGGLRGQREEINKIADLLTLFDKYAVNNNFINPNSFLFVGKNICNK